MTVFFVVAAILCLINAFLAFVAFFISILEDRPSVSWLSSILGWAMATAFAFTHFMGEE